MHAHTASESVPSDDIHEKAVNLATVVYQLEGEGDKVQYVPIHENSAQMVKVALLSTKRVSHLAICWYLYCVYSVYVCSCEMYIDVKSFCGFSFDQTSNN